MAAITIDPNLVRLVRGTPKIDAQAANDVRNITLLPGMVVAARGELIGQVGYVASPTGPFDYLENPITSGNSRTSYPDKLLGVVLGTSEPSQPVAYASKGSQIDLGTPVLTSGATYYVSNEVLTWTFSAAGRLEQWVGDGSNVKDRRGKSIPFAIAITNRILEILV